MVKDQVSKGIVLINYLSSCSFNIILLFFTRIVSLSKLLCNKTKALSCKPSQDKR